MRETPFVIEITVSHCGESLWTNESNIYQIGFPQLFWTKTPTKGPAHLKSCHVSPVKMSLHWVFRCCLSRDFCCFLANFFPTPGFTSQYVFNVKADWVTFFTNLRGFGHPKLQRLCPKWTFNLKKISCVREPTPGTETSFGSPTEEKFAKHVLKEKRYVSSNLEIHGTWYFWKHWTCQKYMIYIDLWLQHQICLQIQKCRMFFFSKYWCMTSCILAVDSPLGSIHSPRPPSDSPKAGGWGEILRY